MVVLFEVFLHRFCLYNFSFQTRKWWWWWFFAGKEGFTRKQLHSRRQMHHHQETSDFPSMCMTCYTRMRRLAIKDPFSTLVNCFLPFCVFYARLTSLLLSQPFNVQFPMRSRMEESFTLHWHMEPKSVTNVVTAFSCQALRLGLVVSQRRGKEDLIPSV